jgi:hypothetical protein
MFVQPDTAVPEAFVSVPVTVAPVTTVPLGWEVKPVMEMVPSVAE